MLTINYHQLRALDTLISVTNRLGTQNPPPTPQSTINSDTMVLISACAAQAQLKPSPIVLERGLAAIPLDGIDVPFHSSFLLPGINSFRSQLQKSIRKEDIVPQKLIGKWIPNLTGKPFQLTIEYFEEVARLTGSEQIKCILEEARQRSVIAC